MIKEIQHLRTLDSSGILMPWYTRPCLEWLDTLDLNGKFVFEYGCGLSSSWFKGRGAIVHGVDDKIEWKPPYDGYTFTTDKDKYLQYLTAFPYLFDVIITDGSYRDDCTEYALKYLKKGGYLIADNFEQPSTDLSHWPKTRELTKHLPLTLYKEPGHIDWQTAVWHNI